MPNAWILHVKQYALKNNLKYKDALKDPACRASYKKGSGVVGMTRYGKPGTFTQDDVARINKEDKERKAMKNTPTVNSVSY
jgi:hypothetical protein